ncbi:MAG: leucine-rich repeat domain-containing protein [Holosporales bacterium]|jgi:hypothetical protein|nr:leucine-rich repeat domain-containing protein [Holosporales bacterium]
MLSKKLLGWFLACILVDSVGITHIFSSKLPLPVHKPRSKSAENLWQDPLALEIAKQQQGLLIHAPFPTPPPPYEARVYANGRWAELPLESIPESATEIVIQNGVTVIGSIAAAAFKRCRNLRKLTIPSSVAIILCSAFYGLPLTNLTFQGNSSDFGERADHIAGQLRFLFTRKGKFFPQAISCHIMFEGGTFPMQMRLTVTQSGHDTWSLPQLGVWGQLFYDDR